MPQYDHLPQEELVRLLQARDRRDATRFGLVLEANEIASCLSSLDDLIATQNDKLEAFKTHKKGLMQQMFPHGELTQGNSTNIDH